jgi:predicted RNA-binding Zn-ribbon protein involved in translation (DUF1610 family)
MDKHSRGKYMKRFEGRESYKCPNCGEYELNYIATLGYYICNRCGHTQPAGKEPASGSNKSSYFANEADH